MADNIPYPGNPGLPKEVRDKILSTFRHSLNLFKTGKAGDCAVGCDFILKMDPRFSPARSLLARARDPNAPLDLELMESFVAQIPAPAEKLGSAAPDKLLISAIEAYADRKFDEAIEDANRVLAILPGNTDAREILEKSKRKKDLIPHAENFRQRALFALESGQIEEARLNYERLRGLDPEHPDVETLGERLKQPSPPAATMAVPAAAQDSEIRFDLSGPGPAEALPFTPSNFETPTAYPPPIPAPPAGSADAFPGMDGLSLEGFGEPPAESPPVSEWASLDETPREESPKTDFGSLWGPSSEPSPALSSPSEAAPSSSSLEIERLLKEGDDLAGRDPQGAIEIWSRVFLTDLSNAAAAERIEKTRAKLLETNRRVTDALNAGRSLYEAGKAKEARERFLEVLAIDENEPAARSFLQRIEDDLAHPPSSFDLSQRSASGDILSEDELPATPSTFPAPATARARPAAAERPKPPLGKIVAATAVLALAIALFLVLRPHAAPSGRAAGGNAAKTDILAEADRLIKTGNAEEARQILSQIPASDPRHARAQQVLASLEASAALPTSGTIPVPPTMGVTTPAPGAEARRSEAEAALLQHRFIAALSAFNLCASSYSSDAAFRQEMAQARERVNELSPAVKLYNDGDYEAALPILWRLYQADHQNQDARTYLVRGYYDLGVMNLQNSLFEKASKDFSDALGVDPEDPLSKRQKAFADRYLKRSPDLLAQIYIKYLRPRP
jgi:tetratricopeptide (TPR) repeat protein